MSARLALTAERAAVSRPVSTDATMLAAPIRRREHTETTFLVSPELCTMKGFRS